MQRLMTVNDVENKEHLGFWLSVRHQDSWNIVEEETEANVGAGGWEAEL